MKFAYKNKYGEEVEMTQDQHRILGVCKFYDGYSITNSEIKREGKVKLSSKDIGITIAQLRKRNFINYHHIKTGRKCRSSGRYQMTYTSTFSKKIK